MLACLLLPSVPSPPHTQMLTGTGAARITLSPVLLQKVRQGRRGRRRAGPPGGQPVGCHAPRPARPTQRTLLPVKPAPACRALEPRYRYAHIRLHLPLFFPLPYRFYPDLTSPGPQGDTRLCLYGLGNIRDERLGRAFQTPGCVQWWVGGGMLVQLGCLQMPCSELLCRCK